MLAIVTFEKNHFFYSLSNDGFEHMEQSEFKNDLSIQGSSLEWYCYCVLHGTSVKKYVCQEETTAAIAL
jgi:hypothetical protein